MREWQKYRQDHKDVPPFSLLLGFVDFQARDRENTIHVELKRPAVALDKKTNRFSYVTTKVKDSCVGMQGRQVSPTCLHVFPGIPAHQEGGNCQEEQAIPQLLEAGALCQAVLLWPQMQSESRSTLLIASYHIASFFLRGSNLCAPPQAHKLDPYSICCSNYFYSYILLQLCHVHHCASNNVYCYLQVTMS